MEIDEAIGLAIQQAKTRHSSRENSTTITKLQEALMWHREDQRVMAEMTKRSGIGMSTAPLSTPAVANGSDAT